MLRKALLSSAALLLAGSAASAMPKNVTTVDVNGAKLSIMTNVGHGTQHPGIRVPGAVFSDLDTKYPNGTYTPWEAYLFTGGSTEFGIAFTTGAASGQKTKGFDVALELVSGTGGVTVCLENDSSGAPSGTCVGGTSTYFANGSLTDWGTLGPTLNATFASKNLTSSTQYWVVAVADAGTTIAADLEDTDYVNSYTFGETFSGNWSAFSSAGFVPALEVIK